LKDLQEAKNFKYKLNMFKQETYELNETTIKNQLIKKKENENKHNILQDLNNDLNVDNKKLKKDIDILKGINENLLFELNISRDYMPKLESDTQDFEAHFSSVELINTHIQTR
jgi:hypothetical protein